MFRQVLSALFSMMERYESFWKGIKGSESLELFGFEGSLDPEPVNVNLEGMVDLYKAGYKQFSPLWKDIFSRDCFEEISKTSELGPKDFHIPTDAWIQILYDLAATYHLWDFNRNKLLDLVTPLYYARVASFVRQSWDMTSEEAEALVEEQATKFEENKEYLIKIWDERSEQKMANQMK
jgi:hypothetical protein